MRADVEGFSAVLSAQHQAKLCPAKHLTLR